MEEEKNRFSHLNAGIGLMKWTVIYLGIMCIFRVLSPDAESIGLLNLMLNPIYILFAVLHYWIDGNRATEENNEE